MSEKAVEILFYEPPHFSVFAGIPILEQAQGWFEGLWNWVSSAANAAASWLLDQIGTVLGRWNSSTGRIEGGILGFLWDAVSGAISGITGFLGQVWTGITSSFNWLSGVVWGWFSGALSWIGDTFNWLLARVSEGFTWVASEVTTALDGVGQSIASAFSGALSAIWDGLTGALGAVWNWLTTEVPKALAVIGGWISSNIIDPIVNGLSWIFGRISDAAREIITGVLRLFDGVGDITPDIAMYAGVGGIVLTSVSGAVMAALSDVASTKVLGCGLTFDNVGSFAVNLMNPSIFMGAVVGTLADVGISKPLLYYYNAWLRPEIPDLQTATHMLLRGYLTEEQFSTIAAKHGYNDSFIAAMRGLRWQYPDVGTLTSLNTRGAIPDSVHDAVLHQLGYDPTWAASFRFLAKRIPGLGDLTTMLLRGLITEDSFKENLRAQGVREEDVDNYLELTRARPGPGEILSMATHEAWDSEFSLAAPDYVIENLGKFGYSAEWAGRFWTSQFSPLPIAQGVENYYRGLFTKEDLTKVLEVNHVHPAWRQAFLDVVYQPPSIRILRYGLDAGFYDVDDLARIMRWTGLSPDDADKAARAFMAYQTNSIRGTLRTEALDDYVAGLDTEEELRTKLKQIGTPDNITEMWVLRAQERFTRNETTALSKISVDDYVKGLTTVEELKADLKALGLVDDRISLLVQQADGRRRKAAKTTASEKSRLVTESKLAQALDLGLVSVETYTTRLIAIGYTASDAQLLASIETTPAPLTDAEKTRRRTVVQNEIARLNRSYDLMILQIDAQTSTLSDEIQGAQTTLADTLNVYDTELTFLADEASTAAPDKLPKIQEHQELLKARRDVAVDRGNQQLTKLQDSLATAADKKQQILKNRDDQLADLNSQLATIGGVAA